MHTTPQGIIHYMNPLGQVLHHPAGYVQLEWEVQPLAGTPFRCLMQQAQELCTLTNLPRLYTDHRGMPPVWAPDCEWLVVEWLPHLAAQLPGCCVALVRDVATFIEQDLRATQTIAQTMGLQVAYFEAEEPALRWLQVR